MTDTISSLLFYPFDKGQPANLVPDSKTLFWNLRYISEVQKFTNFDCLQSFKPEADLWQAHDIEVMTELPAATTYQNIFCVLPKQKDEALYMMARSFSALEDGGLFICVAANDAGGKNIEKWIRELGGAPASLSKSKCRIVWAYNKDIHPEKIATYLDKGSQHQITVEGQSFITQAGIFGWNKIDKGSTLLLQNLPESLKGTGADFGCGYGYLSFKILKKHTNIKKLYVLEADHRASACTQENLKPYEDNVDIEYGWLDLTRKQDTAMNLDWIVMNPPFHTGKQMSSEVGQSFITQAANALKAKGVLYMVANAHLPYEKTLEKSFSNVTKTCEEQGYKVFIAQK